MSHQDRHLVVLYVCCCLFVRFAFDFIAQNGTALWPVRIRLRSIARSTRKWNILIHNYDFSIKISALLKSRTVYAIRCLLLKF